jgi:hypothetical protein
MLDYRMHYAVMMAEDRLRPSRQPELTPNRGLRRVFRLGGERVAARDAARR